MPTPLTPDEEFDALFRQGLEHHPEQPETPAAWHRMDLLLDADLRQQALRRKVLRLLGAESVLLLLLLWLCWVVVPGHLPQVADAEQDTANLSHTAGSNHGLAPAEQGRLAAASAARATAASRSKLPPESALAAWSAPATAPVAQPKPAGDELSTQPAATPKTQLAAPAMRKAPASSRAESASQQLAADIKHPENTGRFHAQEDALLVLDNPAISAGKQPTTTETSVAAATPAARRPRRSQKNTAAAATNYATANAAASGSQRRFLVTGRPARQRPAIAASGNVANTAAHTKQAAKAINFGIAIDPLAPRWPATELATALPDSLRPVALVARPAPADSLPPRPQGQRYRLQLGLVAAPELSAVRPNRLVAPGPSVGVQLDYRLAQRWHLGTALLYSVKRYGAAGTDYTVPYALPHGWVIRDVDAVCRIIDIPLNLRYDLWQQPHYQAFISAGLSSLLMKREQYTYNYDPVYGRPVPSYAIEVDNGSRHLLKVLNLSAGYERLLSPRWSVQAEAFAKLPLAGVGYGAVRLRSAGVFFSLRYGLLPGRAAPVPGRQ
jgi:hypothetical protein